MSQEQEPLTPPAPPQLATGHQDDIQQPDRIAEVSTAPWFFLLFTSVGLGKHEEDNFFGEVDIELDTIIFGILYPAYKIVFTRVS